jgi:hypothetical protein
MQSRWWVRCCRHRRNLFDRVSQVLQTQARFIWQRGRGESCTGWAHSGIGRTDSAKQESSAAHTGAIQETEEEIAQAGHTVASGTQAVHNMNQVMHTPTKIAQAEYTADLGSQAVQIVITQCTRLLQKPCTAAPECMAILSAQTGWLRFTERESAQTKQAIKSRAQTAQRTHVDRSTDRALENFRLDSKHKFSGVSWGDE